MHFNLTQLNSPQRFTEICCDILEKLRREYSTFCLNPRELYQTQSSKDLFLSNEIPPQIIQRISKITQLFNAKVQRQYTLYIIHNPSCINGSRGYIQSYSLLYYLYIQNVSVRAGERDRYARIHFFFFLAVLFVIIYRVFYPAGFISLWESCPFLWRAAALFFDVNWKQLRVLTY